MNPSATTRQQRIQEAEYLLPIHYLDLVPQLRYVWVISESYWRIVAELIAPFCGQRVLDAGCGDGRLCYNLRKENLKLTGIDFSARAIAFAKAFNPDVEFIVADLTTYRPDKVFNVICMVEVLEHFPPELISKVLDNLHRCLRDDGKMIVTVPSTNLPVTPKHYQHFSPETLRATLRPYFEVTELYGHIKMGLKRRVYLRMMRGQSILGTLRRKFWIFNQYFRVAMALFHSIERCAPEEAERLIAVCRNSAGGPTGSQLDPAAGGAEGA